MCSSCLEIKKSSDEFFSKRRKDLHALVFENMKSTWVLKSQGVLRGAHQGGCTSQVDTKIYELFPARGIKLNLRPDSRILIYGGRAWIESYKIWSGRGPWARRDISLIGEHRSKPSSKSHRLGQSVKGLRSDRAITQLEELIAWNFEQAQEKPLIQY